MYDCFFWLDYYLTEKETRDEEVAEGFEGRGVHGDHGGGGRGRDARPPCWPVPHARERVPSRVAPHGARLVFAVYSYKYP